MDKRIYKIHADMCKVFTSPVRIEILNLLLSLPIRPLTMLRLALSESIPCMCSCAVITPTSILDTRYSMLDT